MVKVKPTANQGRITIRSNNDTTIFGIKDNLSEYYARLAERWANSPDMVNGIDYSSKYYAQQSKASAQIASDAKTETQNLTQDFDNKAQVAKDDIEQNRIDSINAINSTCTYSIEEIQNKSEQAFIDIETKASVALENLEQTVDVSIAEYTEISNQIKQDNSEASKLAKDWATSEVLVDNIDYSAKYYAEKAKDNSGIFYDELTYEDIDVDILEQGYVSDIEFEEALATKQDKGDYATKTELSEGLDTKQDKGDYALTSDIPDLTDYVKNTDYITTTTAGLVKVGAYYGTTAFNGFLCCQTRTLEQYDEHETTAVIGKGTLENIKDDYVKRGVTTNAIELTEDEKANAKQWLGYATPTDIMQAIASIPQFKLSIVEALPATGEKMTLYLVSKGGESPDVYDEYIWIEQTSTFEFLGTTAVDLTDYVKNTDYAGIDGSAGIIKTSSAYGVHMTSGGHIRAQVDTLDGYNSRGVNYLVGKGTLENIKNDLVKRAVTANDIELTDDEKTSARTWLGAVGNTDYATTTKGGVFIPSSAYGITVSSGGYLSGLTQALSAYNTRGNGLFICKGTLENVLTQYSKTVLTTEADYEALETKDANTLYLIEE